MKTKLYYSTGTQEYASRCFCMYHYYDKFTKTNKCRKKKEYLRKIFNAWYKCPNWNGEYTEDYWKFIVKFNSNYTFKQFIYKNQKLLTFNQTVLFLKVLNNHIKLNI